jgi:hypothetical protein
VFSFNWLFYFIIFFTIKYCFKIIKKLKQDVNNKQEAKAQDATETEEKEG